MKITDSLNQRRLTRSKLAIALSIGAIMFGFMDHAHAACSADPMHFITFEGPISITIPHGTPDGTTIYHEILPLPLIQFACTTQELWGLKLAPGRGAPPVSNAIIFPLGYPGLSFQMYYSPNSNTIGYLPSLTPLEAGRHQLDTALSLMIVKTGPVAPNGAVKAGDLGVVQFGSEVFLDLNLGRDINVVTPTCETPDVSVAMGDDYKLADLAHPGSSTREVPFNLKLNNCPEGIASVNYQLRPLTPVLDAARGIVGLNSTSSALGIGLQIKDENGLPVPLSTARTFNGYNASGGSFTIPFTASYHRLANASFSAGSANTEVSFVINYQ